jgi:hypothetical protein
MKLGIVWCPFQDAFVGSIYILCDTTAVFFFEVYYSVLAIQYGLKWAELSNILY